ncbi:PHA/PHB synthase family protein [Pseudomaricurvus sp.]|uniref:PHA/PHB synthase family protein n=1 Tax=Pseudomaricurvus sp. TaxID=2004510 RepID=UPI003F6C419A
MNHASAVPGIDEKRSSVKPEIFSEVDIIEKAPEKRIGKHNGRASQTHPPVSSKPVQPELESNEVESKVESKKATPDDVAKVSQQKTPQAESAAPEPKRSLESSLERLKRSSQALNHFADGLRRQYELDEARNDACPAESVAADDSVTEENSVTLEDTVIETAVEDYIAKDDIAGSDALDSGVQLHANVPEKYLRYSRIPNDQEVGPFKGKGLLESTSRFFLQAIKQPDVFAEHYTNFAKELLNIVQARSSIEPERKDKRFRDAVWRDNFLYRSVMQTYLAWDKEVSGWVEDLDMDDADRRRSRFLYEQLSAMLAPTNSPLNPVAVKRAYQTGGKSVVSGLKHLVDDIQHNHGMPTQVLADSYTVGEDLGISPGAVVYRSEVLELIQYQMEEGQVVSERPVLIVPPQLNKFYVFDLTPKNSIVKYLQSQGVQPFIISWRNPSKHNAEWNLDRYVSELESAIEVMCEVTGSDQINLASACAGGLTSMALLGYLQAANKPLVHSHSMFVTALQADDSFQLGLFASREAVEMSRKISKVNGFMDGKSLSHIFAWLRPTDLVWNFWINNYLLGKEPPAMDVLYWDNDSTRLPAGLHSDFLDIFLKDAFANPNTLEVKGHPIDVKKLTMDFYCVGGDEDYLMPWKKCFEAPDLVDGKCTFVLSNSGHIQSVLRPPGIANTYYYTNEYKSSNEDKPDAEQWLQTATKNSGSWWEHWSNWVKQRSGSQRFAPSRLGSDQNPPLSPAPGLYVNEKVS